MTVPKCSAFCSYGRRIIPYLPSVAERSGEGGGEEKRERLQGTRISSTARNDNDYRVGLGSETSEAALVRVRRNFVYTSACMHAGIYVYTLSKYDEREE